MYNAAQLESLWHQFKQSPDGISAVALKRSGVLTDHDTHQFLVDYTCDLFDTNERAWFSEAIFHLVCFLLLEAGEEITS